MDDSTKAVVYKNSWVSLENNHQTQVYEHVSLKMNTATTDNESIQLTVSLPVLKFVSSACKTSCTTKSNQFRKKGKKMEAQKGWNF